MSDYKNPKLETKRKLASIEDTPVEILQELSKDSDRTIRSLVAGNPITPTEILIELGKEFPEIVTENPIFSLLWLEDPNSLFIRLSLARSSTTDLATLDKLASDCDMNIWIEQDYVSVHKAIAQNPHTPPEIIKMLKK